MKKFLSLVLAMIMALSLVTISAGATEYQDLTDVDEIQYEEAVAVLNKIGIITGYEDGSFRPEGLLTRQAAAKIIVSLLIGPEAAENLTVPVAPYPDVPVTSQFAAYISYCKTANIISGYSDGTFKPEGTLTGYAFAKMLLGAVGYRGDIEGFTGSGWTMNVAKIGNAANLFDRLQFQGGEAVNREVACQLALNTLKATMVEYSGGFNVTAGDAVVTGAQTRSYVTSNQDYASHINNRKVTGDNWVISNQTGNNTTQNSHYTVEFGEEHFKDLRLNDDHVRKLDDFGRPSNTWSWKKVTFGVFPIEPDFVYTEQVTARDDVKVTDATKVRALGLTGYEVTSRDGTGVSSSTSVFVNGTRTYIGKVADIADYTDNGTVVEVYVDEDDADFIRNVVIVHTQLMQVKKVNSDSVTLKLYNDDGADTQMVGFNNKDIAWADDPEYAKGAYPFIRMNTKVEDVEVDDDCYSFLSGLKVDDIVAVVPVDASDRAGKTYEVAAAYTPETVTGALTGSKTFANSSVEDNKRSVTEVTVGGTTYKVATWNKDLNNINRNVLKITKKDVTLYLDEFGNAMLAKDVGATNNYMILGSWRSAVVDGNVVRIAEGWDIKGNPVSLNVGADKSTSVRGYDDLYYPGDVLHYTNDGATGSAEWVISKYGVYDVTGNNNAAGSTETYSVKASNSMVKLGKTLLPDGEKVATEAKVPFDDDNKLLKNDSLKTIYVVFDSKGEEVDYIEVKDGLQNITQAELQHTDAAKYGVYDRAVYATNPKNILIKNSNDADVSFSSLHAEATLSLSGGKMYEKTDVNAVVIKVESSDASLKNLGYVYDLNTANTKIEGDTVITDYKVFTIDEPENQMTSSNTIGDRRFVRFTELEDDMYRLREYNRLNAGTSTMAAWVTKTTGPNQRNNSMFRLDSSNWTFVDGSSFGKLVPNIHDRNYVGQGEKTDLTIGDSYIDLINVNGAKFLDLIHKNANAIDSGKELKAWMNGEYTNGVAQKFKVHLAFNDNPSSDDFRLAYIVVIVGQENAEGAASSGSSDSKVLFSTTGTTVDATKGTISDASITPYNDGSAYTSFTLTVPNYVKFTEGNKGTVTAGKRVKVTWQLFADGMPLKPATDTIVDAASGTGKLVPNKFTTVDQIKSFTITDFQVADGGTTLGSVKDASKIELRISKVVWGEVVVDYVDKDASKTIATGTLITALANSSGHAVLSTTLDSNKWDTSSSLSNYTYTLVGDITAGNTPTYKAGNTGTTLATASTTDTWLADGTSGITVNFSGLKAKTGDAERYSLKGFSTTDGDLIISDTTGAVKITDVNKDLKATDTDATVYVNVSGNLSATSHSAVSGGAFSGAMKGEVGTVTIGLTTDSKDVYDNFTITMIATPVAGQSGEPVELKVEHVRAGGSAVATKTITFNCDYEILPENVTITAVEKAKMISDGTEFVYVNDTTAYFVIAFSAPLKEGTDLTALLKAKSATSNNALTAPAEIASANATVIDSDVEFVPGSGRTKVRVTVTMAFNTTNKWDTAVEITVNTGIEAESADGVLGTIGVSTGPKATFTNKLANPGTAQVKANDVTVSVA